jgi:hypothetical protein
VDWSIAACANRCGAKATLVTKALHYFLSSLAKRDEAGRRCLWANVFALSEYPLTAPLVRSALEAVEAWSSQIHDEGDRFWRNAIHGAFHILRRATEQSREYDELIPARLLALFGCENYWVAGISLRYFEWFPRFREHCLTRLVDVACRDQRRPDGAPFGLNGVAFVVLWGLSPELARHPQLRAAWQECITGHLKMALDSCDNSNCQESYERNCLIANQLMWL